MMMLLAGARADDWPQWRGPDRDGISRETGLLKQWPEGGPKVLWERPLGEGWSTVSEADGRAFTQYQADGAQWVVACELVFLGFDLAVVGDLDV